jgi:hypothetical protein
MIEFIFLVANLSLPTNTSSITGFLSWTNGATNNLFGEGILLATFLIILIGSMVKGVDVVGAFVTASFVGLLLSLIMILVSPPLVSLLMPGLFGGLVMLGLIVILARGSSSVY